MKLRHELVVAAAAFIAMAATGVHAEIVAWDDFQGPSTGAGWLPGTSWAMTYVGNGNSFTYDPAGLAVPGLETRRGSLKVDCKDGDDGPTITRQLASPLSSHATVFISFRLRTDRNLTTSLGHALFLDARPQSGPLFYFGGYKDYGSQRFVAGTYPYNFREDGSYYDPPTYVKDTTYLIIAEIHNGSSPNTSSASLWVNPELGVPGTPAPVATKIGLPNGILATETVSFVVGDAWGFAGGPEPEHHVWFDELRIGTTFQDVTAASVPLPAAALAGAAFLGTMALWRIFYRREQ